MLNTKFKILKLSISIMIPVFASLLLSCGERTIKEQPLYINHALSDKTELSKHIQTLETSIETSINNHSLTGAVLVILRENLIVREEAFGWFHKEGEREQMTAETIFDLASLTKPLATAAAIMKLVEQEKICLTDNISKYLPAYTQKEQSPKIIHLLTHTSGLPPYIPVSEISPAENTIGGEAVIQYLNNTAIASKPGKNFNYSCTGYILLQQIVESVTEKSLADFTRKEFYEPLNMESTSFLPSQDKKERIAPAGRNLTGKRHIGKVHDPLARDVMGGVSGNAGLFSTAGDLAVFAAMLLNKGKINGVRVLNEETVKKMTSIPESLSPHGRALGWDIDSPFSTNKGSIFGEKAYGHTGFTGTSILIDPETKTAVILLAASSRPGYNSELKRLRKMAADAAASSFLTDK